MVRANQYVRDIIELRHARNVSTVRRCALCRHPVSNTRSIRPRHLHLLRRRDVRQGHRDGSHRSEDLPGRHLEPS